MYFKLLAVPVAISCLLLAACGTAAVPPTQEQQESSVAPAAATPPAEAGDGTRIVSVTAVNWAFVPDTVVLKKGEKAALEITGTVGNHGLAIADLNLKVDLPEGETVTVPIPTDVAGSFAGCCSVLCGEGHRDMKLTVLIQE